MTGGNTLNGKKFIPLCMLGYPQLQNDQMLIMTKGKGLDDMMIGTISALC